MKSHRMLEMIRLLGLAKYGFTAIQISNYLGINKRTVRRYLWDLEKSDYPLIKRKSVGNCMIYRLELADLVTE